MSAPHIDVAEDVTSGARKPGNASSKKPTSELIDEEACVSESDGLDDDGIMSTWTHYP